MTYFSSNSYQILLEIAQLAQQASRTRAEDVPINLLIALALLDELLGSIEVVDDAAHHGARLS